jgi:hypothetical protein
MALARGLAIYCNGVSLPLTDFSVTAEAEELETTHLGLTARTFVTGFMSGTLGITGIWDYDQTNADEIHNILSAAMTGRTENVVTVALGTFTSGTDAHLLNCVETSNTLDAESGQLIQMSADFRATTGVNFGKCLFNAEVDTTTTNGTSIDGAAATSNGGLFQVHYQNGAGTEDLTAKIQHSTDNSVWADLGTITVSNITGFGASSSEIARGTTVNRYIRAQIAVAQGALNVQAAFARR